MGYRERMVGDGVKGIGYRFRVRGSGLTPPMVQSVEISGFEGFGISGV